MTISKKWINILSISALLILLIIIIKPLFVITSPFLLGYLISKIFIPIIQRLKIKNNHLISLIIFILILLFIGLFSIILFLIGKISISFLSNIVKNNIQIKDTILNYYYELKNSSISFTLGNNFNLTDTIENLTHSSISFIINQSSILLEKSLSLIKLLPQILIFIIITFISAFFFTKDSELIKSTLNIYFSKHLTIIHENKYYNLIKNNIFHVFFGYLRAQLILMTITFFITSIGLYIIGIENFIIKALIISILDALPIIGTAILIIPWAISKLILKKYTLALSLFILYLILTITRQSLEPKIFSEQIGLYPLLTLFSIYGGLNFFGFIGIFLGPILFIIAKTLLEHTKTDTFNT